MPHCLPHPSPHPQTGTRHVVVQNRAAVSELLEKCQCFDILLQRGRSTLSTKNKTKEVLLEEKEERVRHLEEVNMALKQTNDDLNEEVADLKKQLAELQTRVCCNPKLTDAFCSSPDPFQ